MLSDDYGFGDKKENSYDKFTRERNEIEIKNALEKQKPKVMEFDENDLNVCPVCKEHVMTDDNYCKNCGQRIVLNGV